MKSHKKYNKISFPKKIQEEMDTRRAKWIGSKLKKAPLWCSVDLRDGNQALITPMDESKKQIFFNELVKIGFKEIEVGYPFASDSEYQFLQNLAKKKVIPEDVYIQVLVSCKSNQIEKTFESIKNIKKAIVHFYIPTSPQQRETVLKKTKKEIIESVISSSRQVIDLAKKNKKNKIRFQFSPESFTSTELDFALEVCLSAINIIKPTKKEKLIINLPATVERSSPVVFADQIAWMSEKFKENKVRDKIILCVHTHNDRGTAVAATELALLAGADRVEGTLFGNGERSGNVDIATMALNMLSDGVNPNLDFSNLNQIKRKYTEVTGMKIDERRPYSGDLVFTAFSGGHQDAMEKARVKREKSKKIESKYTDPYLHIDPVDLGLHIDKLVRINSQSGKGGLAYVLGKNGWADLPKLLIIDFSSKIQKMTQKTKSEIPSEVIMEEFKKIYFYNDSKYKVGTEVKTQEKKGKTETTTFIYINNKKHNISGVGSGSIESYINALSKLLKISININSYEERSLGASSDAQAVCYVRVVIEDMFVWGVGMDQNTSTSWKKAILKTIERFETLNKKAMGDSWIEK